MKKRLGVYYLDDDYIKLFGRTAILFWDCVFLYILQYVILFILSFISDTYYELIMNTYYFMPLGAILYFTFIKRTRLGGLGYWIMNAKLVDIYGNKPSIFQSFLRSMFLFFGPGNILIDYLWLHNDDNRQTIRDKVMGTYVVKDLARPYGAGEIVYSKYFMFGLFFMFPKVKRSAAI